LLFNSNWTFRGHANSLTDDSTQHFADKTIHGHANSRIRCFADMPIHGLWMICRKTFCGPAGLFTDKLFEVTALPVASSQQAGAHLVAVPTTCY